MLERDELLKELNLIRDLKKKVEKSLFRAPAGGIRCQMLRGRYPQYYLMNDDTIKENVRGKYLKKKDWNLAKKLSQKEYDLKLLRLLENQEKVIEYVLAHFQGGNAITVYKDMPCAKRILVKPYIMTDEEFLENWYKEHPGEQNSYPKDDEIETERGEIVRSKTEKFIADKLFYNNIPYVYEPALVLKDNKVIYPDFLILNVRTRKMRFLEHFGRMDDPNYCKKALEKIDQYERNGIHLGDQLLITMESSLKAINVMQLDSIIKRLLI